MWLMTKFQVTDNFIIIKVNAPDTVMVTKIHQIKFNHYRNNVLSLRQINKSVKMIYLYRLKASSVFIIIMIANTAVSIINYIYRYLIGLYTASRTCLHFS